ncbi:hypothetical protein HZ989_10835 [Brevundimonas sp. AJA228-03]|uniref:hypothetical protein n=1 Tax=Brevundimonas sp. AJA228-03 TaxID=2752515 RepID=UPI001AE09818|nr:hypothetical protein [Brevundimonas sp. AJA228-03]QTN18739.1 hypothetical protein HZ989_10835 [Brevundimonas sp. AJA228-03]
MTQTSLRRLIDLPGVADLEAMALMKPGHADPARRDEFPEVDQVLTAVFGLTAGAAEDAVRPDDWDGIERLSPLDQVEAFAAEGWDVTDAKRKPLRMLAVFAEPLALAMRGAAGSLPDAPFVPEPKEERDAWGAGLAAEAVRFRKR